MAKSFLTSLQLNGNSILNGRVDARWSATPSGTTNPDGTGAAVAGQISSYAGALYVYSGSAWTALSTGAGTVTSVTGTSPVVSSGGTTPAISLASGYGDTQNPYAAKTANYVLAAPNGSSAAPTFRALVAADIPTLNQNTTGSAGSVANSLTFSTGLNATYAGYNGSQASTLSVVSGTTSTAGIVQLSDSTSTTSSVLAATATAAKAAYDRGSTGVSDAATAQTTANAALPKAGGTMSGAIAMGNNKITGLGTPTAAADAATKDYVDNVSAGINIHDAVVAATTGTIAGVYAAGSTTANPPGDGGTGVGATITYSATGVVTLDTSVTLAQGDRVLVKDGVTAASGASSIANGVYVVTTAGAVGTAAILTRATDSDNSHFGDLAAGDLVYVIGGNTYGGDQFVQTTKGTATQGTGSATVYSVKIGTDAISYTQFSGAGAVPNATNLVTGIASFPSAQFSVSSGAVTIASLAGSVINSSVVGATYGGTGVNNGSSTITLGGNLTTSGAHATTLTTTGTTSITLPTSGTLLATTGSGSSLTFGTGSLSLAGNLTTSGAFATTITATATTNVTLPAGTSTLVNTAVTTLSSLASVGTITTGVWNGTAVGLLYGGTGATTAAAARTNLGATTKVTSAGSGTGTSIAVAHGLGTAVIAQLLDSTGAVVEVDVVTTATASGTTTFTFSSTQTLSNFTYVIIG